MINMRSANKRNNCRISIRINIAHVTRLLNQTGSEIAIRLILRNLHNDIDTNDASDIISQDSFLKLCQLHTFIL